MRRIGDRHAVIGSAEEAAAYGVPRDLVGAAVDLVTGLPVTVLPAVLAAEDHGETVARLRAWSGTAHPHLAEVRAVVVERDLVHVVCEPLRGAPLAVVRVGALGVRDLQELAAGAVDALAALHRRGVVHGAVSPWTLLVPPPGRRLSTLDVTVLPVALTADRLPVVRTGTGPHDDLEALARAVLDVLGRIEPAGLEEAVLAAALTAALTPALTAPVPRRAGGPGDGGAVVRPARQEG